MLYTKESPVGIDIQIQRMQTYLYNKLIVDFDCEIHAYGRAYKDTDEKDSTKPRFYLGDGNYREILTDDTIKGLHFFFIEDDSSETLSRTCLSSNTIDVIVIVDDLRKVKSEIIHYPDEEIKEIVKSYLKSFFEMESVTKGEEALNGFDISKLHFIYPYYVFKITGVINNY